MILYQYSPVGVFGLRFPAGTTRQYLEQWVASRAEAFRILKVYRLELQDMTAPAEPPY